MVKMVKKNKIPYLKLQVSSEVLVTEARFKMRKNLQSFDIRGNFVPGVIDAVKTCLPKNASLTFIGNKVGKTRRSQVVEISVTETDLIINLKYTTDSEGR